MYYFILTPNCLFKLFDNNNCKKKNKTKKKLFSRTNLSKRKSVCNYIFRVPLVDDRRRTFIHSSSKNAFNSSWCNLMGCPNNNNINLAGTPIDTTMCDNVQIGNLLDDLMELNFLNLMTHCELPETETWTCAKPIETTTETTIDPRWCRWTFNLSQRRHPPK